jgi:hypothetical protein
LLHEENESVVYKNAFVLGDQRLRTPLCGQPIIGSALTHA